VILGKTLFAVDSHTAGMPTRIVIGGVPFIHGNTMIEKRNYFKDNLDFIRTALMQEPRGLMRGIGAVITSPADVKADLGVIFMDSSQYVNMCGHGSMGVITVAIEHGIIKPVEPVTPVILDTVAGLVTGYATIKKGFVESVAIENVPSFLIKSTILNVPDIGRVPMDIAFGGNFFAIINANDIGVTVDKKNIARLSAIGVTIMKTVNSRVNVVHPQKTDISSEIAVRIYETDENEESITNVVIFDKGEKGVDRSPCGTGTSAHLATLYAKGQIMLNQKVLNKSIIGTVFEAQAISATKVGQYDAIVPEITGKTYTMGISTFLLTPNDPLKHGFSFTFER